MAAPRLNHSLAPTHQTPSTRLDRRQACLSSLTAAWQLWWRLLNQLFRKLFSVTTGKNDHGRTWPYLKVMANVRNGSKDSETIRQPIQFPLACVSSHEA